MTDDELNSPESLADRRAAWARAVDSDDRTVLCAERDGEIIGVLSMGPPYEADVDAATAGQLYQIHVHPDRWGQGVGGLLHARFVDSLRSESLSEGVLEAWERNERAQGFYARYGWEPDGHERPAPAGARYLRLRLRLDHEV